MANSLKIGVAGLGTVGVEVVRNLAAKSDLIAERAGRPVELVGVSARDKSKDRGIDLAGITWFDDPVELAQNPSVDLFVELIGGDDGAANHAVREALGARKHVVTANKALLARHGNELARLAEDNMVSLGFEAAVAGGVPIVKAIRESMAGNRISRVFGILNGTCNYILTRMETEGLSFADVLKEAQKLGYAEADPTFDIGGHDTAHKLAILTSLAFGTKINSDAIYLEGIETITSADITAAEDLGYRIKLLGVAVRTETGIEQRVHPTMVEKSSPIAQIDGVTNAVGIDGDMVGEILLVGPGAGGAATASAVIADIADIVSGTVRAPLGYKASRLKPYKNARMRTHEGGYFIRLKVPARPGAFAAIAKRMAEHDISLQSIMQRDLKPSLDKSKAAQSGDARQVILITHETMEKHVREALQAIQKDGNIVEKPQMIRIERP
ncbi:MAG: homoserine dehydrogenase [Fimbriimonadaceae bacterium]|nr:homoserine dehydrogenase [Alphaproteobacteria bacterium]